TKVKSMIQLLNTSDSYVPCVSLITVTAAPGMIAPCASLTVPKTVPVVIWANADAAPSANTASIAITLQPDLIILAVPPGSEQCTHVPARPKGGTVATRLFLGRFRRMRPNDLPA